MLTDNLEDMISALPLFPEISKDVEFSLFYIRHGNRKKSEEHEEKARKIILEITKINPDRKFKFRDQNESEEKQIDIENFDFFIRKAS